MVAETSPEIPITPLLTLIPKRPAIPAPFEEVTKSPKDLNKS